MSLLKNSSYLLTDIFGNIYHILYKDNNIEFVIYDKVLSSSPKKNLFKNCNEHFFAMIDKKNKIYVIYQSLENNNIYFNTYSNGNWNSLIISDKEKDKIYEPYMIKKYNNFHVFHIKKQDKNNYDFIHTSIYNEKIIKNTLFTIETNGILNSYNIIPYNKGVIILYIDLKEYYHNIVMRYFDLATNNLEEEIILNGEKYEKYYLDALLLDEKLLSIVYTAKQEDNFKVVYDHINLDGINSKVESRAILSNLSNPMYPTIINHNGDIWTCWYEYQGLVSSVKRKDKETFEGPYLWKNSKGENILRYGYSANVKNNIYKLNHAFGIAPPNISFIGFGNLVDVEKIPLKKNLKDGDDMTNKTQNNKDEYVKPQKYYEQNYSDDKLDNFTKEIEENKKLITKILQSTIKEKDTYEELNKRIEKIEEKLSSVSISNVENDYKELENRIKEIEDYLTRRRRGSIFGSR